MAKILVIEDDPDIASLLSRGLGAAGHHVDWVETPQAAQDHLSHLPCDAAIIDMMLGEESGAALLARIRSQGHAMPAIMLSALSRVEDRTEGLDAGAQDYVAKPFQMAELVARIEVQLRRTGTRAQPVTLAGLSYDHDSRRVSAPGTDRPPVTLTEREGELLAYLLVRPGQLLTRGDLFGDLWARHGGSTENVVDVYLGYLRRKLDNFAPYGLSLRTLRGRGFVLAVRDKA